MQKLHKLKPSLHLDMWALVMTSSFLFPNCHSENHTLSFKTMQVLCACLGQSVAKWTAGQNSNLGSDKCSFVSSLKMIVRGRVYLINTGIP